MPERICVQCGNCCPDSCPSKDKAGGDGKVPCLKDPTIVGEEIRGIFCHLGPGYWWLHGIACQSYYPPKFFPDLKTEKLPNGQVIVVRNKK